MKINYKNKKSIERLLKQGFGYSLFTVSNEKGFEKIAIKKSLFKKNYTLTYFNEDVNAIETKDVKVEILDDNTLSIEGYGKVTLEEASFALKNPTKQVERENEIFRQIDRKAREEEITKSNKLQAQIIENKDAQIKQIKADAKKQKEYYTYGIAERLKNLKEDVLRVTINHDSYDYEQVYKVPYGYQMESRTNNFCYEEKRGVTFLTKRLENVAKQLNCNAFEDNRLSTLIEKINNKFEEMNEYDESKLTSIQALYGLLAEELTVRTYNLCNYIRENNITPSKLSYSKTISSGSRPYFEERHEWTVVESIDDYYNTLMESVAVFTERVTGQDIRKEIELRLTQQYIIVPVLTKTFK